MHIGTVEIPDCEITNYQTPTFREIELTVYIEDQQTIEALKEQGKLTKMVVEYDCFQSEKKYYDTTEDGRNILDLDLACGTLEISGVYMQRNITFQRTPGGSPGWFVTMHLIKLEG